MLQHSRDEYRRVAGDAGRDAVDGLYWQPLSEAFLYCSPSLFVFHAARCKAGTARGYQDGSA